MNKFVKIILWVFSIIFFLLGIFIISSDFFSFLFLFFTAFSLNPFFSDYIYKKVKLSFFQKKTIRFGISFIFFILSIVFLANSGETLITDIDIYQWSADTWLFVDFEYNLANLVESYKVATVLEQKSLKLKYNDLNKEEYKRLLKLLEIKRNDVKIYSNKLKEFEKKAPNEILTYSFFDNTKIWNSQSFFIQKVYAQELYDFHKDQDALDEYNEKKKQEKIEEIKNNEEMWKTVSLIKKALPSKKWIDIVSVVFGESVEKAKERIKNRTANIDLLYKSEMDYINETEKNTKIFQNWVKMVEWWWMLVLTLNPVWWATIGTLAMLWVWAWLTDLGITVLETNDLLDSDWKNLDKIEKKYWTVKNIVWNVNFVFNVKDLLSDPTKWSFEKWMISKWFMSDLISRYRTTPESERWYYKVSLDWWKLKFLKIDKSDLENINSSFWKDSNNSKYGDLLDDSEVSLWDDFKVNINSDKFKKYLKELEKKEEEERKKQEEIARKLRLQAQQKARQELIKKMNEDKKTKNIINDLKKNTTTTNTVSKFPKWTPWWTVKYCNSCWDYWMACTCWSTSCKCCSGPQPDSCN